jgi:hypothetical protein
MLLRESSNALDQVVDLVGTIRGDVDSGVPHGELLAAYAEAGPGGLVDAAATVAIFNGLVRSADAIGIPLDKHVMERTDDERETLGLNDFSGSANSGSDI